MSKEVEVLIGFLNKKNLKLTSQRRVILDTFLKTGHHVSAEDLYDVIRKNNPEIGLATVFRTLKLLREADIAKAVDFGDRRLRYEHKYGHKHHDHLICVRCGKFIEVFDEKIEKLQNELCKKARFTPERHKMEIFGVCRECRKTDNKR
ncbi:MAG: Fur family transcriptional regulator [Candidatus Omnitrophota bacterium]